LTFSARDRWGASEREASVERLRELLQSLDIEDREHPDVSLTHESAWCLSAFPSGLLVWESLEEGEHDPATKQPPRHMKGVSREKVLELWLKLAQGDIASVEAEPWMPGYY
jgi:hypothetical protein